MYNIYNHTKNILIDMRAGLKLHPNSGMINAILNQIQDLAQKDTDEGHELDQCLYKARKYMITNKHYFICRTDAVVQRIPELKKILGSGKNHFSTLIVSSIQNIKHGENMMLSGRKVHSTDLNTLLTYVINHMVG